MKFFYLFGWKWNMVLFCDSFLKLLRLLCVYIFLIMLKVWVVDLFKLNFIYNLEIGLFFEIWVSFDKRLFVGLIFLFFLFYIIEICCVIL